MLGELTVKEPRTQTRTPPAISPYCTTYNCSLVLGSEGQYILTNKSCGFILTVSKGVCSVHIPNYQQSVNQIIIEERNTVL